MKGVSSLLLYRIVYIYFNLFHNKNAPRSVQALLDLHRTLCRYLFASFKCNETSKVGALWLQFAFCFWLFYRKKYLQFMGILNTSCGHLKFILCCMRQVDNTLLAATLHDKNADWETSQKTSYFKLIHSMKIKMLQMRLWKNYNNSHWRAKPQNCIKRCKRKMLCNTKTTR